MIYEYRCEKCTRIFKSEFRTDSINCEYCPGIAQRIFGFAYKPPLPEHFNHTTGQVVRTDRQFTTQLKVMSEQATIRTGIQHTFQPVDMAETSTLGVTEQGLDKQAQRRHDKGLL